MTRKSQTLAITDKWGPFTSVSLSSLLMMDTDNLELLERRTGCGGTGLGIGHAVLGRGCRSTAFRDEVDRSAPTPQTMKFLGFVLA